MDDNAYYFIEYDGSEFIKSGPYLLSQEDIEEGREQGIVYGRDGLSGEKNVLERYRRNQRGRSISRMRSRSPKKGSVGRKKSVSKGGKRLNIAAKKKATVKKGTTSPKKSSPKKSSYKKSSPKRNVKLINYPLAEPYQPEHNVKMVHGYMLVYYDSHYEEVLSPFDFYGSKDGVKTNGIYKSKEDKGLLEEILNIYIHLKSQEDGYNYNINDQANDLKKGSKHLLSKLNHIIEDYEGEFIIFEMFVDKNNISFN